MRLFRWLLLIGLRHPYRHIYGADGTCYMERYWIFGGSNRKRDDRPFVVWERDWLDSLIGRFVACRLHGIMRPDRARAFHDHPAWFISLVLCGYYVERRPLVQSQPHCYDNEPRCYVDTVRRKWSIAFRRASDRHTITEVSPGGCWTLVLWGRKRPDSWFFYPTDSDRVPWHDYKEQP